MLLRTWLFKRSGLVITTIIRTEAADEVSTVAVVVVTLLVAEVLPSRFITPRETTVNVMCVRFADVLVILLFAAGTALITRIKVMMFLMLCLLFQSQIQAAESGLLTLGPQLI